MALQNTGEWTFLLRGPDVTGNYIPSTWVTHSNLMGIRDQRLTVRLNDTSEFSFAVNGYHDDAKIIKELETDILLFRNGASVFRGRVGPSTDNIGTETHDVNFTAYDYREILNRRILYPGDAVLTYAATVAKDERQIAWNLIQATQGRVNGDLGITLWPDADTNTERLRTFTAGQNIGQIMQELSDAEYGMEWLIDASLQLRVFENGHFGKQGPQSPTVRYNQLEYGVNVTKVIRTLDIQEYATAALYIGGTGTTPVQRTSYAVDNSVQVTGRWERTQSETDNTNQSKLVEQANGDFNEAQRLIPSYTVTLVPGSWGGPQDMWVGDTVILLVDSGRINVNTTYRVLEISVGINQEGLEDVTVALARYPRPRKYIKRVFQISQRLDALELR